MVGEKYFPLVSVVILTWNAKKYLERCLESVLKTDYPCLEIIVCDNGSTDGTPDIVRKLYPDVFLIENKSNLGFSCGNNVAIRQSKGNIVVLLNQDTYVDKNWIKEVLNAARHREIGIVGSMLHYPYTSVVQSAGLFVLPSLYTNSIGVTQVDNGQFGEIIDVDVANGAALAIKRSVIQRIGLLDSRFFAYYEDVDLCFRARKAGYRVVTASKAIVYHFGSTSWGKGSLRLSIVCERSRIKFAVKHLSGLSLFKSLTIYDLMHTVGKMGEFSKKGVVVQKEKMPLGSVDASNREEPLKTAVNLLVAKILAYLTIGRVRVD